MVHDERFSEISFFEASARRRSPSIEAPSMRRRARLPSWPRRSVAARGLWLTLACILPFGAGGCKAAPALPTTIIIPQDREDYSPDFGLRIKVPAGFVHSGGEPVEKVDFFARIDLQTGTILRPDGPFPEGVVPLTLSIVGYAAVDAWLNPDHPYHMRPFGIDMKREFEQRYGLNYFEFSHAPDFPVPTTIVMFDHAKPHRIIIQCAPHNPDPQAVCLMDIMLNRGGGLNPNDRYGTMITTKIKRTDLADWRRYQSALMNWYQANISVFDRRGGK